MGASGLATDKASPRHVPRIEAVDPRLLLEPLDYLEMEHYRQRAVLAHLERLAIESGRDVRAAIARLILAFVTVDVALHVADEECNLFPVLRARCPAADRIERILDLIAAEQARDEAIARSVSEGLEMLAQRSDPPAGFTGAVDAFVELQRRHIAWENAFVLPLARRRFTRDDKLHLSSAMAVRRGQSIGILLGNSNPDVAKT